MVEKDYITPKDALHIMISNHIFIFQFGQLSLGPEEADQQCSQKGLITPKDALHSMISNIMFIFQFEQLSLGPEKADQQGLRHS